MLVKKNGTTVIEPGRYATPQPRSPQMYQWMIDSDAGAANITALVDAWAARFGSVWVKEQELDNFYRVAALRLLSTRKLENHFLYDVGYTVYRLMDDA